MKQNIQQFLQEFIFFHQLYAETVFNAEKVQNPTVNLCLKIYNFSLGYFTTQESLKDLSGVSFYLLSPYY